MHACTCSGAATQRPASPPLVIGPPPEDVTIDLGSGTAVSAAVAVLRVLDTYAIDRHRDARTLDDMRKVFATDTYPTVQQSAVLLATLLYDEARQAVPGTASSPSACSLGSPCSRATSQVRTAASATTLIATFPVSQRVDEYVAFWVYVRLLQLAQRRHRRRRVARAVRPECHTGARVRHRLGEAAGGRRRRRLGGHGRRGDRVGRAEESVAQPGRVARSTAVRGAVRRASRGDRPGARTALPAHVARAPDVAGP